MNKFWKIAGCLIVGFILGNIYSYVAEETKEEPKETETDESVQKLDRFVDECRKQVFPDKEEPKKEEKKETLTCPVDLSNINDLKINELQLFYEQWLDSMLPGLGKQVMSNYDIHVSEKPLHKEDK